MTKKAAVVFTYKSIERILRDGGTQSWRMHPSHIGAFEYVVCARNRRHALVEGPEEHGSAFLIGRVRDVVPSTDPEVIERTRVTGRKRFLIRMAEAAIIDVPKFWQWGRWPTHYGNLDDLGIDPSKIDFKPLSDLLREIRENTRIPTTARPAGTTSSPAPAQSWRDLIEAAKIGLGAQLGVDASSIEITVRM
jgi:hypothetical protein